MRRYRNSGMGSMPALAHSAAIGDHPGMIWTLPNLLTIARIAAAPIVALMLAQNYFWPAFLLFTAAALTDFLDGWLARRLDQQSPLGQMLDPIADKVMVIVILSVLTALPGGMSPVYLLPALVILMRETLVSGLREYLGAVKLAVTPLAKWKTTAQLIAIGALLLSHALLGATWLLGAGLALLWLAGLLTLISGWDYFRKAMPYIQENRERM